MSIVTGPIAQPTTTLAALQQLIESLQARIAALEANRQPAPLRLYQAADCGPLSEAANGDAPRYDQTTGLWLPGP